MYVIVRAKRWLAAGLVCLLAVTAIIAVIHVGVPVDAQQGGEEVRLPIIMYHGILREEKRQGKYVISPSFSSRICGISRSRDTTPS